MALTSSLLSSLKLPLTIHLSQMLQVNGHFQQRTPVEYCQRINVEFVISAIFNVHSVSGGRTISSKVEKCRSLTLTHTYSRAET